VTLTNEPCSHAIPPFLGPEKTIKIQGSKGFIDLLHDPYLGTTTKTTKKRTKKISQGCGVTLPLFGGPATP